MTLPTASVQLSAGSHLISIKLTKLHISVKKFNMPWTGTSTGLVSSAVLLRLRNLYDRLVSLYLGKNSTPLPDGELIYMTEKLYTLSEYDIMPSE